MSTKLHKKLVAGFLIVALAVTSATTADANAAAAKTVTVTTRAELNNALKNAQIEKIVIETSKAKKFCVFRGDYTDKQLVVNSPKVSLSNRGNFRSIEIADAESVSDWAKGNVISLKDTNGLKFCSTVTAKDTKISIDAKNAKVELVINGKPDGIQVNAKADIKIIGNTKNPVDVVTSNNAAYSKLEVNLPVNVETSVEIGLAVNKGAEASVITTTQSHVSVTVTNNTDEQIKVSDSNGKVVKIDAGDSVEANATKGTTKEAAEVKPVVDVTPTVVPTATPAPTATPVPTATPAPTVTPTPVPTIHEHEWEIDIKAKDADCLNDGCTEGKHCTVEGCTEVMKSQPIEKLGHDMKPVADSAVAATCTEDGKESDYKCSRCDYSVEGKVIAKTGHTVINDNAVSATCEKTGLTAGSHCSVCNSIIIAQEIADALGHDMKPVADSAVAATCTEDGKESDYKCSRCDYKVEGTVIPKTGHVIKAVTGSAVEATCTDDGKKEDMKCTGCDYTERGETIPAGHTVVIDKAVEPTCKTKGKTEGSHCSVCETAIVKQEIVDEVDHVYNDDGFCKWCGKVDTTIIKKEMNSFVNFFVQNQDEILKADENGNKYCKIDTNTFEYTSVKEYLKQIIRYQLYDENRRHDIWIGEEFVQQNVPYSSPEDMLQWLDNDALVRTVTFRIANEFYTSDNVTDLIKIYRCIQNGDSQCEVDEYQNAVYCIFDMLSEIQYVITENEENGTRSNLENLCTYVKKNINIVDEYSDYEFADSFVLDEFKDKFKSVLKNYNFHGARYRLEETEPLQEGVYEVAKLIELLENESILQGTATWLADEIVYNEDSVCSYLANEKLLMTEEDINLFIQSMSYELLKQEVILDKLVNEMNDFVDFFAKKQDEVLKVDVFEKEYCEIDTNTFEYDIVKVYLEQLIQKQLYNKIRTHDILIGAECVQKDVLYSSSEEMLCWLNDDAKLRTVTFRIASEFFISDGDSELHRIYDNMTGSSSQVDANQIVNAVYNILDIMTDVHVMVDENNISMTFGKYKSLTDYLKDMLIYRYEYVDFKEGFDFENVKESLKDLYSSYNFHNEQYEIGCDGEVYQKEEYSTDKLMQICVDEIILKEICYFFSRELLDEGSSGDIKYVANHDKLDSEDRIRKVMSEISYQLMEKDWIRENTETYKEFLNKIFTALQESYTIETSEGGEQYVKQSDNYNVWDAEEAISSLIDYFNFRYFYEEHNGIRLTQDYMEQNLDSLKQESNKMANYWTAIANELLLNENSEYKRCFEYLNGGYLPYLYLLKDTTVSLFRHLIDAAM
ncbi:MAG: hypothetical protein PUC30_03695 [Lachnospiraceae bacterium]|nr:hypothetical protein [Lachnospiraceae bacterium]